MLSTCWTELPLLVLHDAGIIVMHTAFTGIGSCPQALAQLIRYYKRKRCTLVKVGSMSTKECWLTE